MSTTIDPSLRLIPPDGFPLAVIIVSDIFCICAIAAVLIRTYVRTTERMFGWDDGLMLAGASLYVADTAVLIYGCLTGLGRLDADLNAWQWTSSIKYYIVWILIYVVVLALVKSSICITILRIVSSKVYLKYTIWVMLAITWASFLITFIGTLLYCRPISTIWTPALLLSGEGKCSPTIVLIALGQVATSTSIVTDVSMVIVPAIVLWNTQMSRSAKVQGFLLLSFASAASIITVVRIPYVNKFGQGVNLPFWISHTGLCSTIEIGIGCIAPAGPAMLRIISRIRGLNSKYSDDSVPYHNSHSHQRARSANAAAAASNQFRNPTDLGFSLATVQHSPRNMSGNVSERSHWERLPEDGASDKGLIMAGDENGISTKYTYAVDIEMVDGPQAKSKSNL